MSYAKTQCTSKKGKENGSGKKMKYMGSKSRIKKHIVPIIQELIDKNEIKTYIEPFVGGANVIDNIDSMLSVLNKTEEVKEEFEIWSISQNYLKLLLS